MISYFITGNYPRNFECVRERFDTPDGDIFYADFTKTNPDSKYIVVILHGLESHPKSPLVTKMATAFHSKGKMHFEYFVTTLKFISN